MRPGSLIRRVQHAVGSVLILLSLSSCTNRHAVYEAPSIDGLRFTAVAKVVGSRSDSVHVQVMAHNPTRHERTIDSGACSVPSVRAYAGNPGALAWSSDAWRNAVETRPVVCVASLHRITVPPRDSARAGIYAAPIRTILGDSLAPGSYRIGMTPIGSAGIAGEIPAGVVELRLGRSASVAVHLPAGYSEGPAVLLPDSLHEVHGGGMFRIRIERTAKNAFERDLIELAERLFPSPGTIDSARAEASVRGPVPRPAVRERAGPRWWWSEAHRTLIPYALTGDAVAHVIERVREFSREPLPSYFEPGWQHEVYATYRATVEPQPGPSVAYRVHMTLDFFIACGGRCGYGFVPTRTVDFDMAGNVVAVHGDGRIVQKFR